MGKIILFISTIFILGCNSSIDYKYHIVGKVLTKDGFRDSQWFTDTISFNKDTAFYVNSDSSIVKIYPPFTIYEIKNNN